MKFVNKIRYWISPSYRREADEAFVRAIFPPARTEALFAKYFLEGRIGKSTLFDAKIIN